MIAHYVCNTLYLPLSLFSYPFAIEYKGSFVPTTGRRRRLGRPHKLYIFYISINNRVDIAISIYPSVYMKLQISGEYRVYYSRAQSTVTFSSSSSLSFYLSFHPFLSFYLPSGTCNSQVATAAVAACCRTQRSPSRLGGSATAINFAATFVCLPMRCSCPPRVASLPHLALASPPASQCEKCASRSAFGDSKRSKRIYLAAAFSASIRLG